MASTLVDCSPPTAPIRIVAPGKEWGVEPVELLVERGVKELPEKYRRWSAEEQQLGRLKIKEGDVTAPSPDLQESSLQQIPLIDLRGWEAAHRAETVEQVKDACQKWGFFRIVNHGVDLALMDRMIQAAKDFMALPVEEKAAYVGQPGKLSQGYGSKYTTGPVDVVRDWRDYLYFFLQPNSVRDYAFWPSKPAQFRETLDAYSREVKGLASKLLGVISEGLELRQGVLEEALQEIYQKMLINYYPACPQPHLVDGFHQHSDLGSVTLVMQEDEAPEGLYIHHEDEWVSSRPHIRGSFVVNVGDQIEIFTNGRYKSIEHKVIPDEHKSRISVATFHDAAPQAIMRPLNELTNNPVYKDVKFFNHEESFYEAGANAKALIKSYITRSHEINPNLSSMLLSSLSHHIMHMDT